MSQIFEQTEEVSIIGQVFQEELPKNIYHELFTLNTRLKFSGKQQNIWQLCTFTSVHLFESAQVLFYIITDLLMVKVYVGRECPDFSPY